MIIKKVQVIDGYCFLFCINVLLISRNVILKLTCHDGYYFCVIWYPFKMLCVLRLDLVLNLTGNKHPFCRLSITLISRLHLICKTTSSVHYFSMQTQFLCVYCIHAFLFMLQSPLVCGNKLATVGSTVWIKDLYVIDFHKTIRAQSYPTLQQQCSCRAPLRFCEPAATKPAPFLAPICPISSLFPPQCYTYLAACCYRWQQCCTLWCVTFATAGNKVMHYLFQYCNWRIGWDG